MGRMNIQDEAVVADRKARAVRVGIAVTAAARQAGHGRLARKGNTRDAERRRTSAALMAIPDRPSRRFPPGMSADRPDLHDENGSPR